MSKSSPASPLHAARRSIEAKAQALRRTMSTEQLAKRAKEVRDLFKMPMYIRIIDRISFIAGFLLVCATEYFALVRPELMHHFWLVLLVPLLLHRWVVYHSIKLHYFMLDFCYYCQLLLIVFIWQNYTNAYFFQLVFCLCSGPLACAVIPWKCSLVFHDWDRVTSVFIHVFPPIVTFCLRWHAPLSMRVCIDDSCSITWVSSVLWPLAFYSLWQLAYLIKTELIDAEKMSKDKELATTLRWMTETKPHPLYKAARKHGYKGSAVLVLIAFQFAYTACTLIPTYFLYRYYVLNAIAIVALTFICVWNGASYYFEVFAERYAKEMQEKEKEKNELQNDKKKNNKVLPSSWGSFFVFVMFVTVFFAAIWGLLHVFNMYHQMDPSFDFVQFILY